MNILGWIILGGLAGWVASLITGTSKGQSIFADIVLGIVGAVVGGWVVDILGGDGITGFNVWSFVVALGGAIVVVWTYHAIAGTKRKSGKSEK